ncbi:uncharacterized protein LOC133733483 [Rosa rugosa]|uniref:uncharacterized protein LOC133733483 n=1 Tax=Rosa rugosa TaxID=74645 RepID=UPI002B414F28|nr:uncharacterized protein LOC133733483 [Rosa rugosa]
MTKKRKREIEEDCSRKRRRIEDGSVRSDDSYEIETHKGEPLTPRGNSKLKRKRRRGPRCSECGLPCSNACTRYVQPPIPEGYGYLPSSIGVDTNGHYHEEISDLIAFMYCDRCGKNGDHWDAHCPNPINDPPEPEDPAARRFSWKYVLRDFKGKPEPPRRKAVKLKAPMCEYCVRLRNQAYARTEKPPLPEGYGYLPSSIGVYTNGHYHEEISG